MIRHFTTPPRQRLNLCFQVLKLLSLVVFGVFSIFSTSDAATYYIRVDGGTYDQCDGTEDTAVNSTGKCAWNHPFEALPPGGTSRIVGGDTLIIGHGSYRMGHTDGIYSSGVCAALWPWDCYMPPIPSGPDKDNPTKIYGAGWNEGCSAPPELWGTEATGRIINLEGTSNIELQCLDITDHQECANNHGGAEPTEYKCIKGSAPTGDWAASGLYIKDSKNGLTKNVKIHGLSVFGIKTGAITDWTFDHVTLKGNGYGGFSNDIYGPKNLENSCHGAITFRDSDISWNGCVEKYPDDGQPWQCYDQNQGGYGDAIASDYTVGTWTFDRVNVSFNSSDGIDLLYHRFDLFPNEPQGVIIVRNSYFEGNVGNSIKTRGNAIIFNNMLIGNCDYFNPTTSPYTIKPTSSIAKLFTCRGNATSSLSVHNDADVIVANNSFTGQSDIMLDIGGKDMQTGGETATVVDNVFYGGVHFLTPTKPVDGIYAEWQVSPDFTVKASNNAYYKSKGEPAICGEESTDSLCETDPEFVTFDYPTESFDFRLRATSPLLNKGLPAGSFLGTVSGIDVYVPKYDFEGDPRPTMVSIGADELGGSTGKIVPIPLIKGLILKK